MKLQSLSLAWAPHGRVSAVFYMVICFCKICICKLFLMQTVKTDGSFYSDFYSISVLNPLTLERPQAFLGSG